MLFTVSIDLLCVHGINHVHSEIVTVIFLKYKYKKQCNITEKNQFADNYRPQRSWGKVIFSEACVKNSRWGGVTMRARGNVCGGGGHAWWGYVAGGCAWWGACVAGGVWWGHV